MIVLSCERGCNTLTYSIKFLVSGYGKRRKLCAYDMRFYLNHPFFPYVIELKAGRAPQQKYLKKNDLVAHIDYVYANNPIEF